MNRTLRDSLRGRALALAAVRVALIGVASALTLAPAQHARAQGKIDQKLMMIYGGVLAPDCSNYMLPQLKYLGDSLVVQDGGKAVLTGKNVKAAPNRFGATPPPEFENAVTGEVAGEALVFVFFRDAAGRLSAAVEGGPRVMAAVPPALKNKRVPHCDPNRNTPAIAPPGAQGKTDRSKTFNGYALTELSASGLLFNPKAKNAYYKALGPLVKEPWLARLDGPSSENKAVRVANTEFVKLATCKNHDCYDNSVLLLWAAPDTVFGKVVQKNRSTLIGSPPPAVAAELDKLWKAEFRSTAK